MTLPAPTASMSGPSDAPKAPAGDTALQRLLGSESVSTPRRFRDILGLLLAGRVLRMPEDPAARLNSDWVFFERHRAAFDEYLAIAGFRVITDETYRFAFLAHADARLREVLDKHTSRVAVACRLLFHQAQQVVHLTAGVDVTMRELLERLDVSGPTGGRTARVRTVESLRHLASHGMVDVPPRFQGADEETFTITPVLARRLPVSAIEDYLERTRNARGPSGSAQQGSVFAPAEDGPPVGDETDHADDVPNALSEDRQGAAPPPARSDGRAP